MNVVYVLGRFPVLSETFVAGEILALERLGHRVDVLALGEGDPEAASLLGGIRATLRVLAREGRWRALARIARAALGRPARTSAALARAWRSGGARELRAQVRILSWASLRAVRRAERIHAHFASEPARAAHRLHLATGIPFGVTIHAQDLFPVAPDVVPRLAAASWVVTVCDYNARELRNALPALDPARLHVVPCGVDAERFRRSRPYAARPPRVVAVGRLVPKKGFTDLVEAARLLREQGTEVEVRIAGDGPLREALAADIAKARLGDRVTILGALSHEQVRDEIEAAAILALPAVIAPDGDRDSMPVVLKEAMSLEVPVVGTSVAGLPEAIGDGCGRLVPPHDPRALAAALAELLALPDDALAAIGRRGRAWVLERFRIEPLTARFAEVLAGSPP